MSTTHTPWATPTEVYLALGRPGTSYQRDVAAGLAPPLVALGTRRRALPRAELELLVRAREAGLTDQELRALVAEAIAHREKLAAVMRGRALEQPGAVARPAA